MIKGPRYLQVLFTLIVKGQPHEGSCYAASKDLQMAMHRSEHVKSRLSELEKLKQEHLRLKQGNLIRTYSLSEQPH